MLCPVERSATRRCGPVNRTIVVEDKVDACKLLPALQHDASPCTETVPELGILETVGVGTVTDRTLVLEGKGDLSALGVDLRRVGRAVGETAEGDAGGVNAVLLEEVTGRLGEQQHSSAEDESPCELNSNGSLLNALG